MRPSLGLGLSAKRIGFSDGNLSFTKVLMGMEGADGSTTFVDEGPLARSGIVATGNARFAVGSNPTASATSAYVASGERIWRSIEAGQKIAGITS